MDFTPQAAFNYIHGKLDDFYRKGDTLQAQEQAITALIVAYQNASIDATEVYALMNEVNNELLQWQSIARRLTPIIGYFGYTPPSLGIDPFSLAAIATTLIAVAALLWSWYNSQRIDSHNIAIKTLAANVPMSPTDQEIIDQATTSTGFFGSLFSGLGTMGNYLLIGGAIYLGILFMRRTA